MTFQKGDLVVYIAWITTLLLGVLHGAATWWAVITTGAAGTLIGFRIAQKHRA